MKFKNKILKKYDFIKDMILEITVLEIFLGIVYFAMYNFSVSIIIHHLILILIIITGVVLGLTLLLSFFLKFFNKKLKYQ